MLFPLWLENIIAAAQQWVPAVLLSGFALAATGAMTLSAACCRPVTSIGE